jgi:hypothetical protein
MLLQQYMEYFSANLPFLQKRKPTPTGIDLLNF